MKNLNLYYNPPLEWQYESIKNNYLSLVKKLKISEPISFFKLERWDGIVQVRETLLEISLGLKRKDSACVEISIRFVISPVYFHYSGFIRERMASRLKHCTLTTTQEGYLVRGVEALIANKKNSCEFKEIKKLYELVKKRT